MSRESYKVSFVAYDPADGKIHFNGHGNQSDTDVDFADSGLVVLNVEGDGKTQYVKSGTLHDKGIFNVTQTITGLSVVLAGVPESTVVSVKGMVVTADATEEVEIVFDLPGAYSVTLCEHAAYFDTTLEVTING